MNSEERHEARFRRRKAEREAKRQQKLSPYDEFNRLVDIDNLHKAMTRSMRGVSWKESVQRYYANAMRNLMETRGKLLAGENIQKGFVEFTLHERGKIRHIKSVHISERIVQKCLCDEVLVPILSHSLIHDNGASVKGKGVHFAIQRFVVHLTRFYRQHKTNDGYALLIDFSKFFDNINHEILFAMIDEKVQDRRIRELIRVFVSVFGDGKSLGLGSQISQISAIYYPDRLDHFIKEKLQIHYYGRYMDDLYLLHKDKSYLSYCLNEILRVCKDLKIKVNIKKTKIMKLSEPMLFLKGKYSLLPSGKVIRRPCRDSTIRMRRKLLKFKGLLDKGSMSYADLRTSYQSWRGNFRRRFTAYHRLRYMDNLYNQLFIYNHTP
jgi:hypothetical protein